MKKKIITTQKLQRWTIIERLGFLLPLLFMIIFLFAGFGGVMGQSLQKNPGTKTLLSMILLLLFEALIVSIPFVLIWRGMCNSVRKSILRNVTYWTASNFDYYRDILGNISPATISMVTDLELEPQKDISALILKYALMKVVSLDNDTVYVLDSTNPNLKASDQVLINALQKNRITSATIDEWKKLAYQETLETEYITNPLGGKSQNNSASYRSCLSGCLVPVISIVLIVCLVSFFPIAFTDAGSALDAMPKNLDHFEELQYIFTTPELVKEILILCVSLILGIMAFTFPIRALVQIIAIQASGKRIKRTTKGELLAAQIAGMKKYIHDYTLLSEREKEHALLWNDFAIYAVLLEENQIIIKDIFTAKKIPFNIDAFYNKQGTH